MGTQAVSVNQHLLGYENTALGVVAPAVIKTSGGRVGAIFVIAPGTAGNLTVNDLASTSGDAPANEIHKVPFGSLAAGQIISLGGIKFLAGLAITSVPTGGQFTVIYT